MALPTVDFAAIKATSQEAIAAYGSPADFLEQGSSTGRTIKVVIYRDAQPALLIEDAHSESAKCLMSPADFTGSNRMPQQFDTISVSIDGFVRTYTIEEIHPVFAENYLSLIIASVRAN